MQQQIYHSEQGLLNPNITPKRKSKLIIHNDFHFISTKPKPNWWFRLWQYLLLGWKWEDIN